MSTFRVSDVARATERIGTASVGRALHALLGSTRGIEAFSPYADGLVASATHPFLGAALTAFGGHRPLVLSPDAVWLCLAQGLAAHINANAEQLRGRFVKHAGKQTIEIRRDDFQKGSPANPWTEVFSQFSAAIRKAIGPQRDLFICDFSTTGPVERAVSEIVLMDAVKSYFDYDVSSLCGIPEITMLGTLEDWRSIRRRAEMFAEYDLGWWLESLRPILDELVNAAAGHPDEKLWRSFCKENDGSGGPWVTGWINVFYPYLRKAQRNPYAQRWTFTEEGGDIFGGGPKPTDFPCGLSAVPFSWHVLDQTYPMEFLGGFVGISENRETLELRAEIGWAVRQVQTGSERLADPIGSVIENDQWRDVTYPRRAGPTPALIPWKHQDKRIGGSLQYRLMQKLDDGMLGSTHLAQHLRGGFAAIQIFTTAFASDPEGQKRFVEAASAAAQVGHPGIVAVREFGNLDGGCCVLTDFVPAESLEARVHERRSLSIELARPVMLGLCRVLSAAHKAGCVHGNIHLGCVLIRNFDLAPMAFPLVFVRGFGEDHLAPPDLLARSYFLAPEALTASRDPRTDIYSVGVVFYEMLTGRIPFFSKELSEIQSMHREELPEPPSDHAPVPRALDDLILQCLAKNPADRPQTVEAILDRLVRDATWG